MLRTHNTFNHLIRKHRLCVPCLPLLSGSMGKNIVLHVDSSRWKDRLISAFSIPLTPPKTLSQRRQWSSNAYLLSPDSTVSPRPQWHNRLARRTYKQYFPVSYRGGVRYAEVVSSSLTWGTVLLIINDDVAGTTTHSSRWPCPPTFLAGFLNDDIMLYSVCMYTCAYIPRSGHDFWLIDLYSSRLHNM